MRDKKKYMLAGAALPVILAAVSLVAVLLRGAGDDNPNLALGRGVKATCDSVEQEALSAAMAIDGNDADRASRWSSENNREDASHYIQLEFPEEISVSFVVLKWERANAVSYALESSGDGESWQILQSFGTAPETLRQEIVLEEAVPARFLRLSVSAVSKEEADYSDLYQNVSLYEFEVYGDKPTAYKLKSPVIERAENGARRLAMPDTPEGFRVSLIGADLEQVIGPDGRVYDTIQDKEVTVGYLVEDLRGREETREISFRVEVPASDAVPGGRPADTASGAEEEPEKNPCPDWLIPSVAEWNGGRGVFTLGEEARIIVGGDSRPPQTETEEGASDSEADALWETAALLNRRLEKGGYVRTGLTVCKGTAEDLKAGDIYLGYAEAENGLGREGYTCDITDKCVIKAETETGICWGTVTLLQLLSGDGGGMRENVPQGQIRDYPLYEVRGFGIDVARKPVSLDTLYKMMETMSWYKMNDLSIHFNDNEILATSGLTGSAEQAMTAESAFRLESSLTNGEGEALTSEEYAYTKEEIAELIATAGTYGVTVVPEIDTPAHSLSITKLYPEYALRSSDESVDQIDLANGEAVAFAERLWREVLDEEKGAFRKAQTVNIGMDEYYGDGEQYRQYLTRINNLVQETGRTVRLWGSLSNMGGSTQPSPENLQMIIWSTVWADPQEMYEAGYSLINMQNNHLYIIPGGGYDRSDVRELYENWSPNRFYDYNRIETIPAYSPQMLGASCMIWNDMCGRLDMGISEYDLYERFTEPLGVLSLRLWGAERPEEANVLCEREIRAEYLYAETEAAEPDYEIQMKVWLEPDASPEEGAEGQQSGEEQGRSAQAGNGRTGTGRGQILAEGDCAYGVWAFYAAEPETGKVGFAREGRTYTFDYTLPRGEWVKLKLEGRSGQTTLYVEGKKMDSLGSDEPFEEHATFVFPLQRVGGQTGNFDGKLELSVAYSAAGHTASHY